MDTSVFEQIATSLTVKSICSPLGPDVPAGTPLDHVEALLDPGSDPNLDPLNDPVRVIDADGHGLGVFWPSKYLYDLEMGEFDKLDEESDPPCFVEELMERPLLDDLLTSSTTVLDAVTIFGAAREEAVFYILETNEIVGVLQYRDLFHPLGRLAFLAIALEIEDLALKMCQSNLHRELCWASLPESRKRKAIDQFKRDHKDREPEFPKEIYYLIESTELIDKANMIWKRKLIASATRTEVLGFFHRLMQVRNACAHPRGYGAALVDRAALADFISSATRMRSNLRLWMANYGIGWREKPEIIL